MAVARALVRSLLVIVVALVVTSGVHPAAAAAEARIGAATCACGSPFAQDEEPGLVWRGATASAVPSVADIAGLLAPVLWFSADEPLLTNRSGPIPAAVPCDRPSDRAVVYYQVIGVHLAADDRVRLPVEEEPALFRKARGLVLRFFFYYPEDFGLKPHRHDLEGVDVEVALGERDGCRSLHVRRVTGLAHGLYWYANILKAERDMKFPLTVLVEEGKHASCPDRNADGLYTPGYDVNARVHDAWGIRDVLATGRLFSSGYRAELSKPRRPDFRLLPPALTMTACAATAAPASAASASAASASAAPDAPAILAPPAESPRGRYELRRADRTPVCDTSAGVPDAGVLASLVRSQRFGAAYKPRQYLVPLSRELQERDAPTRLIAGVSARYDGGSFGGSVVLRGFDFGEGWIVPRFAMAGGFSAEALITRSASRWADPYLSIGVEDEADRLILFPDKTIIERGGPALVTEIGFKFRVRVSGRARWATLGYSFGGVRLGVRFNGANELRKPRMIVEIGPGVW